MRWDTSLLEFDFNKVIFYGRKMEWLTHCQDSQDSNTIFIAYNHDLVCMVEKFAQVGDFSKMCLI